MTKITTWQHYVTVNIQEASCLDMPETGFVTLPFSQLMFEG